MQMTFIDRLALWLPGLGGLVPATLSFIHLEPRYGWFPAGVVAAIVELVGFVTIATALDIWELNQDRMAETSKHWGVTMPPLDGQFSAAMAGVILYLVVVVSVNAILDSSSDVWLKITNGLLSTFGLLGGLMLALRNQLGKQRIELAQARSRAEQTDEQARAFQERLALDKIEHDRRMEQERLRLEHDENIRRMEEESRRKLARMEVASRRKVSGKSPDGGDNHPAGPGNSPDDAGNQPEPPGNSPDDVGNQPDTHRRWADVSPDDYRWIAESPVGEIVKRYKITGKDPDRLARTWKQYARRELDNQESDG
jgi:hypothetical protein